MLFRERNNVLQEIVATPALPKLWQEWIHARAGACRRDHGRGMRQCRL